MLLLQQLLLLLPAELVLPAIALLLQLLRSWHLQQLSSAPLLLPSVHLKMTESQKALC